MKGLCRLTCCESHYCGSSFRSAYARYEGDWLTSLREFIEGRDLLGSSLGTEVLMGAIVFMVLPCWPDAVGCHFWKFPFFGAAHPPQPSPVALPRQTWPSAHLPWPLPCHTRGSGLPQPGIHQLRPDPVHWLILDRHSSTVALTPPHSVVGFTQPRPPPPQPPAPAMLWSLTTMASTPPDLVLLVKVMVNVKRQKK